MSCAECDKPLSGQRRKFCSTPCAQRAAHRAKLVRDGVKCDMCGKPLDARKKITDRPSRCNPCRRECRKMLGLTDPRPCAVCGVEFTPRLDATRGLYCSRSCSVRAQNAARYGTDLSKTPQELKAVRDAAKTRKRFARDARGIPWSSFRYSPLVERLRKRPCAYCGAPAETVDHVVPLNRGGLNSEGNLVPACLRCNSSKSDRLLAHWRYQSRRRTVRLTAPGMQSWTEAPACMS